jgi:hypothetical protein
MGFETQGFEILSSILQYEEEDLIPKITYAKDYHILPKITENVSNF